MVLLVILICLPQFLSVFDFLYLLFTGKIYFGQIVHGIIGILVVIIYPGFLLMTDLKDINNCCGSSAIFSPEHKVSIYIVIILSMLSYIYSVFKSEIAPPIMEVLLNIFLLMGIIINIPIAFHLDFPLGLIGNLPIALLFIMALVKNQQHIIAKVKNGDYETVNPLTFVSWKVLTLHPLMKFPLLLIAILPIVFILTSILILFGQKPDAMIRAFTETYKLGLSEWDYKCDNIDCGGHYLCSVAANGHKQIVKPQRLGIRAGGIIVCNRQLLVSNAFEQVLEEFIPKIHQKIRIYYDKVGDMIHKNHRLFEFKIICDLVYIMMKPPEWFFILTLYLVDKYPEQRITRQYCGYRSITDDLIQ
ncbi:MAG: DUF6688 family protein [Saprospiraceae bacterium]